MKYLPITFFLLLGLFACGPQNLVPPIDQVELHQRIAPETEAVSHNLSASRDTTVVTPHGISVRVPANAFMDAAGNLVSGDIELALTEAISTAEMVVQPVSTVTTDGNLLASKGMIKIEAFQNGQPLSLNVDKAIDLGFPGARGSFSGYQLFYGVDTPDGQVQWEVDTMPAGPVQSFEYSWEPLPIQVGFFKHADNEKIFTDEFLELQNNLNDYTKFTEEEMKRYRSAEVQVYFLLFEDGEFGPHTVFGKISASEKEKLIRRFDRLPTLKTKGRTGDVKGVFTFTIETENEKRQRETEEALNAKFYMSINRLGWTNCDIFIRLKLPVAEMKMAHPTDSTIVKLVFSDYKTTVSPGFGTQDSLTFYNVPMGAGVSVVAISPHAKGVSMSITPTVTSPVLQELNSAEIMSKEEMVQRLNALN